MTLQYANAERKPDGTIEADVTYPDGTTIRMGITPGGEENELTELYNEMEADPSIAPPPEDPSMVWIDGDWGYKTPAMLQDENRAASFMSWLDFRLRLNQLHPTKLDNIGNVIDFANLHWTQLATLQQGVTRNDPSLEALNLSDPDLDELFGIVLE